MTMMAAAIHLKEASTAAMATVWVESVGVGVCFLNDSNSWWWNSADSASRQIYNTHITRDE
jgi:hypothetical protein